MIGTGWIGKEMGDLGSGRRREIDGLDPIEMITEKKEKLSTRS